MLFLYESIVACLIFTYSVKDRKRRYLVVKTKYRQFFLVAHLYGSYPMPVMFSYCLIGSYGRVLFLMSAYAIPILVLFVEQLDLRHVGGVHGIG